MSQCTIWRARHRTRASSKYRRIVTVKYPKFIINITFLIIIYYYHVVTDIRRYVEISTFLAEIA